jgi:hypothetical protein
MHEGVEFVRVGRCLVDVVPVEDLPRFLAAFRGSKPLKAVQDSVTFSGKAFWDDDAMSWAVIQGISWSSVTGCGPLRIQHVDALEITLSGAENES